MALSGADIDRLAWAPDMRLDALLIGCALAFAWLHIRDRVPWQAGPLALGGIVILAVFPPWQHGTISLLPAMAIVSVFAVAAAVAGKMPLLEWRPLVAFGRISYGVYLWHAVLLWGLIGGDQAIEDAGAGAVIGTLGLAIAAAALSWFVVERPAMRLRRRREAAKALALGAAR